MFIFIQGAHLIQMSLVVSPFHKKLHHLLIYPGYGTGKASSHLLISLQKRRRQHQIADTDGGSDCFGKGSDINDSLMAVASLQGRNRLADITEFTVIVILNNITSRPLRCPLQQLLASFDRHNDAKRILVGGHHIGNIRSAPLQLFHIHA